MRRQLVTLAIFAALFAAPLVSRAEDPHQPRAMDSRVAMVVTTLIDRDHLSRRALDDEISKRAIRTFLNSFDRMKLYFTQADIDEFMESREQLDDQLRARDMQFAFTVFNRFHLRVKERVKLVDELLEGDFDFSKEENIAVDPEAAKHAASEAEVRDLWRRQLKYELLLAKADKIDPEEAQQTISRRYHNLARRTGQLKHDDVLERYLTAVASSYDPHTSYFSPSTLEEFRIRMGLNYQGIGAELESSQTGQAVIRRVMPGGGAATGGQLKAKDRIVRVGQGEDGDMVDVRDKSMDDVISLIRGKEGTVVRVGVIPEGQEKEQIYNITRTRIELNDKGAQGRVIEQGVQEDGRPFKVGVIELPSFYMDTEAARRGEDYRSTTKDVRKILDGFREQSVDAVVLDLRRNGGGSLPEAVGLTGLFIDGPVVQIKDPSGRVRKLNDTEPGMAWDGPLVVLTSKFSASASEILAGAVQDYQRGLIVGDVTTHGKGTVQSLIELGRQLLRIDLNLGALKITMQQFYRPNGDSTQARGVLADVVLPSMTTHLARGEKDLDYAIEFDKVPAATFQQHTLVSQAIVDSLKQASKSRCDGSEDFQKLRDSIVRFQATQERKTMPLKEDAFRKIREEMAAADDDEDPEASDEDPEAADEAPGFYLSEVVAITVDYVKALQQDG